MYLQALQCVSVFLFPGGALTIHQARALTGFTVYLRAFMKFTLEFKVRVLFEYELYRTCFPENGRVVGEKEECCSCKYRD